MAINVIGATWVIGIGAALLTGCGVSGQSASPPTHQLKAQRTKKQNSTGPATSILRVMPNRLPVTAQTKYERINWPIYNNQLAMNQFPTSWHGNDLVNTWKLPPKWAPYLYKNEKPAPQFVDGHRPNLKKIPLTLYITLQGTVFLYPQTIMQSQWPVTITVGDVPPTTIVAEFVPLKPAVEAGIIPENANQPSYPGSGFVPRVWQKALGMSSAQIFRLLR